MKEGDNMEKKACFIANPSFGKSEKDDLHTIEELNKIIEVCDEYNCKNIVICGGMYNIAKKDLNSVKKIEEKIDTVSRILPKNLHIRYKILSGACELYVLKRSLIDMNHNLAKKRDDVDHIGFDRVVFNDTLVKCTYGKQNNLGFNDGEVVSFKGHMYDPSIRLNNIIGDYDKDLVLIGGKNRFEEFVYNNKIVIALPSLVNPYNTNKSPDLGYIMIDREDNSFDVKQHVKVLNKKPEFK